MKPLVRVVYRENRSYEVLRYNMKYGYWPKTGKKYSLKEIREFLKREKNNLQILFKLSSGELEKILGR